jgi:hypothetical protein
MRRTIAQYGRPTLMMFLYSEGKALLKARARLNIDQWFAERALCVTQEAALLTADQINEMVHECRA